MEDYIVRAIAANDQIRAFACTTRNLVENARQIHNTSPVITAALGRLLSAGAMMGSMMKGDKDLLTLQIKGNGPVGGLIVTANSQANVKGYAEVPEVIIPAKPNGKLDVSGAIGEGYLLVIRDMGLKEPYVGRIPLQTGEIAEDLTYYYAASEQVPSSVGLGVLMNRENTVRCAGGFIIQLMPYATEEVIARLEENLSKIQSVTTMLDGGDTPEQMLTRVLEGFDVQFTETQETHFRCDCSRERLQKVLISLGREELGKFVDENEPVEIGCQFCNSKYLFTIDEIKQLLEDGGAQ